MHRRILRALSSSFRRNEESPCYPIRTVALIFYFPKLKTAMERTTFESVLLIQQTDELKAVREKAFSLIFCAVFMASVREVNCYTVCDAGLVKCS
jgi:hypothetical protein